VGADGGADGGHHLPVEVIEHRHRPEQTDHHPGIIAGRGSPVCVERFHWVEVSSFTMTTQIWLASPPLACIRRTKAILLPSGENTHASGRGALASSHGGVRRRVSPVVASVTQTLLSMTCAMVRP